MIARTLTAIGMVLALSQAPALAGQHSNPAPSGYDIAVNACVDLNGYQPAHTVAAVEDGLGDWLVWVEDKDGDLWMCNANEEGAIYTNVMLEGDLLEGSGVDLVGFSGAESRNRRIGPAATAEAVCSAIGNVIEDMEIVATVDDGLGDYLVWLENDNEDLWVCNASADALLYVFEPIDYPINDYEAAEDRFA